MYLRSDLHFKNALNDKNRGHQKPGIAFHAG
jgi:hypothetical protein